jgi:7-carboxy-7-deazaguanine synthase
MSKILIESMPSRIHFKKEPEDQYFLRVAEFFSDTIQGEGASIGHPAAFLRLQGCTLCCTWCDTREIRKKGNPYTFDELCFIMEKADLIEKFKKGHHLVITGGSPLKQQDRLVKFILDFYRKYEFKPYIEIENECVLEPNIRLIPLVDQWNNSPKLASSGNLIESRYQPDIIRMVAGLKNSWFKFVVNDMDDWEEIEKHFLTSGLIKKDQIIIMPLGAGREELLTNRERLIDISIEVGVRYSTREHIILWGDTKSI